MKVSRFAWAAAPAYILAGMNSASAQVAAPVPVPDLTRPSPPPETLSAAQTASPEYQPLGIRMGGFILRPAIDLGLVADSNIYGSSTTARSDMIARIAPALDLASEWNTDALGFHADGQIDRHARYAGDDIENATTAVEGRLDLFHDQTLSIVAGYQSLHEDRASPDAIAAAQATGAGAFARYPTPYQVAIGRFDYIYAPSKFGFALSGSVDSYSFGNVPTTGGELIINGDRNRTEYSVTPKVSYTFEPGSALFVQATGDIHAYDALRDATPEHFRRSSSGYTVAAGAQFDIGRIVTGQFYVGWQSQDYDDARLRPLSGIAFGGSALWNFTRLTSFRVAASRSQQETIIPGSSGLWDTSVTVGVEHRLMQNLLLTLGVTYDGNAYEGIRQTDDAFGLQAGAQWALDRNVSLGAVIDYTDRSSSLPADRYDRVQFTIDLKAQL